MLARLSLKIRAVREMERHGLTARELRETDPGILATRELFDPRLSPTSAPVICAAPKVRDSRSPRLTGRGTANRATAPSAAPRRIRATAPSAARWVTPLYFPHSSAGSSAQWLWTLVDAATHLYQYVASGTHQVQFTAWDELAGTCLMTETLANGTVYNYAWNAGTQQFDAVGQAPYSWKHKNTETSNFDFQGMFPILGTFGELEYAVFHPVLVQQRG